LADQSKQSKQSKLFMVATPIGNLADLSPRALEILSEVDLVACEDTRHTLGLLKQNNISKRLVSLHEHNEYQECESLLAEVKSLGQSLAYVSDAGTPGISDPGSHLAAAAHRLGMPVLAIAGPSALAAALSVCGFGRELSIFSGFLPRKDAQRDILMEKAKAIAPCNFVFFESPNRIIATIRYLQTKLDGDTEICVCRELTKIYETTIVSKLSQMEERLKEYPERGEFVIVVSLDSSQEREHKGISLQALAREAVEQCSAGRNLKDAARVLARKHAAFSSREIYQEALKVSSEQHQKTSGHEIPEFPQLSLRVCSQPDALNKAKAILSTWFEQNLTRNSVLEIDPSDGDLPSATDISLFIWCARLYKRGFQRVSLRGSGTEALRQHVSSAEEFVPQMSFCEPDVLMQRVEADIAGRKGLCILDGGFVSHWPKWNDFFARNQSVCIRYTPEESTKRIETVVDWSKLITSETRVIWTVGGGIASDMGGLLAGLFGLVHKCSPTTLLSACDASIGGKTGVNFPPFGKNQLGLFYPTSALVLASDHFFTLDRIAILCGLSETIKHLWLVGGTQALVAQALKEIQLDLTERDKGNERAAQARPDSRAKDRFAQLVQFNYQVKAAFVRADPIESGLRKALNFGHTLAHVIEGLGEAGYLEPLDHGVAVAIGMLFVLRSQGMVDSSTSTVNLILDLLKLAAVELPLKPLKDLKLEEHNAAFKGIFAQLIQSDKKVEQASTNLIPFVAPEYGYFADIADHSLDTPIRPKGIDPCLKYLTVGEVLRLCMTTGILDI
jgi:16S rRNA (cytidine1402-2'-O)-methyltransferase